MVGGDLYGGCLYIQQKGPDRGGGAASTRPQALVVNDRLDSLQLKGSLGAHQAFPFVRGCRSVSAFYSCSPPSFSFSSLSDGTVSYTQLLIVL